MLSPPAPVACEIVTIRVFAIRRPLGGSALRGAGLYSEPGQKVKDDRAEPRCPRPCGKPPRLGNTLQPGALLDCASGPDAGREACRSHARCCPVTPVSCIAATIAGSGSILTRPNKPLPRDLTHPSPRAIVARPEPRPAHGECA